MKKVMFAFVVIVSLSSCLKKEVKIDKKQSDSIKVVVDSTIIDSVALGATAADKVADSVKRK